IVAGDGNDFVEGGLGNDTLNGGLGGDTLVYVHATGGMTVDTQLGFTSGPDGQDSLLSFEIIKGSDFADTIIGGQNSINLNNRYLGRGGDDTLIGTNSTDILNGGAGDDNIRGGGGDDILKGAAGDDLIIAGAGNDVLRGGKGSDTGVGGKGYDVCKSIEKKKSCEA
ncbi:MAG TPA: calcium-binding protein, partial [Acidimicrobiia bacterium]